MISGIPVVSVQPAEEPGGPFRLSGVFFDRSGALTLRIVENEWQATADAWDIQTEGPRLKIWERNGVYSLVVRACPPGGIAIEKMRMRINDREIEGNERSLRVRSVGAPPDSGLSLSNCILQSELAAVLR